MDVTLALSALCEHPARRTGLSTLFPELVRASRRCHPNIRWVVFAPRDAGGWPEGDPGVEIVRHLPGNDRPAARLLADHFLVAPEARRRGASALVTVGFCPVVTAGLPIGMHVLSLHHLGPGGGLRGAYRRWAVGRGLGRAAVVFPNSEWTASRLGPVRGRVIVSPEGVRHDLFHPGGGPRLPPPGLPPEYLLWVSNFYGYKRAGLALAAYARLDPAVRARFPLVMVGGEWKGGRDGARAEAARLGVADQVLFLGWVDDAVLPALYRAARAHVLSTAEETFGRSVLEAMACGCPNVIQDLPVLREVAGDAAAYVDFSDAAAAAAALARVCLDDAWAGSLAAGGVRRAESFSFERLADERVRGLLGVIDPAGSHAAAGAGADGAAAGGDSA